MATLVGKTKTCQKFKVKRSNGFTLIELLISMSLFSLLMLSALLAYDFMNQNWQRNKKAQQQATESYIQWQLLYDVVINTFPKLLYKDAASVLNSNSDVVGFYFLGREEGYTAVSATSIQRPESAAVYRIFKEPSHDGGNLWQLVYEEALLSEQLLVSSEQNLDFSFRRVLLANQMKIDFRYQGWRSSMEKITVLESSGVETSKLPDWHTSYDGFQTVLHPMSWQIVTDNWTWQQPIQHDGLEQLAQLDMGL